MPSLTSKQAVCALVAGAAVHELTAAKGQLISHLWDEWMRRPVLTTVVTFGLFNALAIHLCNVVEGTKYQRFDPFAGFGYPLLSAIKGRPA